MWGKPPEYAPDEGLVSGEPVEPLSGFDAAHRRLRADTDIQFEMRPMDPPQPPLFNLDWGSGWNLGPLFQVIFWVVVALAAAGLAYVIISRLTGLSWRRRGPDGLEADAAWRPTAAKARTLLEEADRLAADGRYSEAAHLLLHRSIEDIDERRPAAVKPALTSRDIARLPSLPTSPAQAFAGIVRAVERSLFGGRALDAADWRDCRAAYERFALAGDWR